MKDTVLIHGKIDNNLKPHIKYLEKLNHTLKDIINKIF